MSNLSDLSEATDTSGVLYDPTDSVTYYPAGEEGYRFLTDWERSQGYSLEEAERLRSDYFTEMRRRAEQSIEFFERQIVSTRAAAEHEIYRDPRDVDQILYLRERLDDLEHALLKARDERAAVEVMVDDPRYVVPPSSALPIGKPKEFLVELRARFDELARSLSNIWRRIKEVFGGGASETILATHILNARLSVCYAPGFSPQVFWPKRSRWWARGPPG